MNIEIGPESRKLRWNPERAPRLHTNVEDMNIEDVERTLEIALEDPDSLSLGDREVLEHWIPILASQQAE